MEGITAKLYAKKLSSLSKKNYSPSVFMADVQQIF